MKFPAFVWLIVLVGFLFFQSFIHHTSPIIFPIKIVYENRGEELEREWDVTEYRML
jgi:hypothetical protein